MSIDIKASRAICDAATPFIAFAPGATPNSVWACQDLSDDLGAGARGTVYVGSFNRSEDLRFFAHARTALPAALDEIERLREALQDVVRSMDCNHPPDDGGDQCDGEDCIRCSCAIALAGGEG